MIDEKGFWRILQTNFNKENPAATIQALSYICHLFATEGWGGFEEKFYNNYDNIKSPILRTVLQNHLKGFDSDDVGAIIQNFTVASIHRESLFLQIMVQGCVMLIEAYSVDYVNDTLYALLGDFPKNTLATQEKYAQELDESELKDQLRSKIDKDHLETFIQIIVSFCCLARVKGLLYLETFCPEIGQPFFHDIIMIMINGVWVELYTLEQISTNYAEAELQKEKLFCEILKQGYEMIEPYPGQKEYDTVLYSILGREAHAADENDFRQSRQTRFNKEHPNEVVRAMMHLNRLAKTNEIVRFEEEFEDDMDSPILRTVLRGYSNGWAAESVTKTLQNFAAFEIRLEKQFFKIMKQSCILLAEGEPAVLVNATQRSILGYSAKNVIEDTRKITTAIKQDEFDEDEFRRQLQSEIDKHDSGTFTHILLSFACLVSAKEFNYMERFLTDINHSVFYAVMKQLIENREDIASLKQIIEQYAEIEIRKEELFFEIIGQSYEMLVAGVGTEEAGNTLNAILERESQVF